MSPARGEGAVIPGPAGDLQAIVENANSSAGALYGVLCHPHPLYGGTFDNKVITTLSRALLDLDIPSVRFNFRGVGSSAGSFDQGRGEIDDAIAVADWAALRWPARRMVAAGFSFGGFIALKLALNRPSAHLVTVAPAIRLFEPTLERPSGPWLIVQGEADEVVDPKEVATWAATLDPPPHLVMLPGVGHFFHGRLHELRDTVVAAIRNG